MSSTFRIIRSRIQRKLAQARASGKKANLTSREQSIANRLSTQKGTRESFEKQIAKKTYEIKRGPRVFSSRGGGSRAVAVKRNGKTVYVRSDSIKPISGAKKGSVGSQYTDASGKKFTIISKKEGDNVKVLESAAKQRAERRLQSGLKADSTKRDIVTQSGQIIRKSPRELALEGKTTQEKQRLNRLQEERKKSENAQRRREEEFALRLSQQTGTYYSPQQLRKAASFTANEQQRQFGTQLFDAPTERELYPDKTFSSTQKSEKVKIADEEQMMSVATPKIIQEKTERKDTVGKGFNYIDSVSGPMVMNVAAQPNNVIQEKTKEVKDTKKPFSSNINLIRSPLTIGATGIGMLGKSLISSFSKKSKSEEIPDELKFQSDDTLLSYSERKVSKGGYSYLGDAGLVLSEGSLAYREFIKPKLTKLTAKEGESTFQNVVLNTAKVLDVPGRTVEAGVIVTGGSIAKTVSNFGDALGLNVIEENPFKTTAAIAGSVPIISTAIVGGTALAGSLGLTGVSGAVASGVGVVGAGIPLIEGKKEITRRVLTDREEKELISGKEKGIKEAVDKIGVVKQREIIEESGLGYGGVDFLLDPRFYAREVFPAGFSNKDIDKAALDEAKKLGYKGEDAEKVADIILERKLTRDIGFTEKIALSEGAANIVGGQLAGSGYGIWTSRGVASVFESVGTLEAESQLTPVVDTNILGKNVQFRRDTLIGRLPSEKDNKLVVGIVPQMAAVIPAGVLTSVSFGFAEKGLKKLGKPGVATANVLGQVLDPFAEATGDISTGIVKTNIITSSPSFVSGAFSNTIGGTTQTQQSTSFENEKSSIGIDSKSISSESQSKEQDIIKVGQTNKGEPLFNTEFTEQELENNLEELRKTKKGRIQAKDFQKGLISSPTPQTSQELPVQVEQPIKEELPVKVEQPIQEELPVQVEQPIQEEIPVFTNVPTSQNIPSNVPITIATPDIPFFPTFGGPGAGFGNRGSRGRSRRRFDYVPDIQALVLGQTAPTKSKPVGGFYTGLERRFIINPNKTKTSQKPFSINKTSPTLMVNQKSKNPINFSLGGLGKVENPFISKKKKKNKLKNSKSKKRK